ncbi:MULTISPECIES: hypothetical protein [Streptomycetaceae]
MSPEPNDDDQPPMFPALSILERQTPPARYGREPFWRAPVTPPSRDVYIPHWNWIGIHEIPADREALTLDANGAYLAAIGAVQVAHSHLKETGGIHHGEYPSPRQVLPGYYRVRTPYWAFSGTIVSPLGDSSRTETEESLWVAHPTLQLMLELHEQGALADVVIYDSWTSDVRTDFRDWSATLRELRLTRLDAIDQAQTDATRKAAEDQYDAFKEGYSAALSMMLTGEKCRTRRPDWNHAVLAHASAAMWRKAWRWTETGRPLISMGATDEITVIGADLPEVMSKPKPPFKYDPTGRQLGALKPKPNAAPVRTDQRAQDVPMVLDTDGDDIL